MLQRHRTLNQVLGQAVCLYLPRQSLLAGLKFSGLVSCAMTLQRLDESLSCTHPQLLVCSVHETDKRTSGLASTAPGAELQNLQCVNCIALLDRLGVWTCLHAIPAVTWN